MAIPSYATRGERIWHTVFLGICALVFLFLVGPLLVIIPLSFNAEPYFTFSEAMLRLDPAGYSLRWYEDFFTSSEWLGAIKNSFIVGIASNLGLSVLPAGYTPAMPFLIILAVLLIRPHGLFGEARP